VVPWQLNGLEALAFSQLAAALSQRSHSLLHATAEIS